jgi:hypothetical protein
MHFEVLRAIAPQQSRSCLGEVTRERLLRTSTKLSTVTVRKALRDEGASGAVSGARAGVTERFTNSQPVRAATAGR